MQWQMFSEPWVLILPQGVSTSTCWSIAGFGLDSQKWAENAAQIQPLFLWNYAQFILRKLKKSKNCKMW